MLVICQCDDFRCQNIAVYDTVISIKIASLLAKYTVILVTNEFNSYKQRIRTHGHWSCGAEEEGGRFVAIIKNVPRNGGAEK